MNKVVVGTEAQFEEEGTYIVDIEGLSVAVLRHKDRLYAYRNVCPHQGGPACEGIRAPRVLEEVDASGFVTGSRFDDDQPQIICPWHGYSFHLKTGKCLADERLALKSFPVSMDEGNVIVTI